MRKLISLTAAALCALSLNSQTTQVVRWVNTVGGGSTGNSLRLQDAIKGMVEDDMGNTYVIGNYTGTISFTQYSTGTNGIGTTPISYPSYTSENGSQDIFLARFDLNGLCTWSMSIGGDGFDEGNAICMSDPSSPSDFYITGMFHQSMEIGANTLNAVASGYQVSDAFIIRFNTGLTVNPSLQWYEAFGGYSEACGTGIAVQGSNVFVTGYYTEYCMDASANIILAKTDNSGGIGGAFYTSTPGYLEFPYRDMFIARYSTAGVFSTALCTFGSSDQVEANGIALLGTDLYVTGTYKGTTRFTNSTVACSGHSDIFVARYPQSFTSTTPASSAITMGGPSTAYQASSGQPPYKPDAGYGIAAASFGVFVTGRFMDQATFGAAGTINPSGSSTETYMFLVRLATNLGGTPVVVTGSNGYSEGRAVYVAPGGIFSPLHPVVVAGGGVSTASVNGVQIESNGFAAENVGFVSRIAYTSSNTFSTGFVDGIAQNQNYLNGTGANDINVMGFAVTYRAGCAVRIGGRFSSKCAFGNREKTASGGHDAFLSVRENAISITANTFSCGSNPVVLTGTGGSSPMWAGPSVSSATTSVTVTPTATSTYTFTATAGSCPSASSPVTIHHYPSISSASAGPDKSICEATHSTQIGTPPLTGATYSWSPSSSLSSATAAQPIATVSVTTTYTMTMTDTCGGVTTDVVTVYYEPFCPHRLAGPGVDTENQMFSIFPNPTNGQFTITTSSDQPKDVMVYDMNGRLVYSVLQTTDNNIAVDISSEAKGLYVVKVITGNDVQSANISNQ